MISLLFGSARFYHPTIKPGELYSINRNLLISFLCLCQSLHPDAMTLLRLSAGYFCAFRRLPASRIQDLNERFWSLCLRIAVANPRRGADAPLYSTSFITWGLVPPSEKSWKRHWIVCIISSDFMRTMVVPFMKHYLCVGIYVTAITITIYTLTQSACS